MAWKIYSLEWGNYGETKSPGEELGEFLKLLWPEDVKRKWVPRCIYSRDEILHYIGAIDDGDEKVMAVFPEGGNHHYTYGLCKAIADKRSRKYIYNHLDYHSDDYSLDSADPDFLADNSFVNAILRDTNAVDVVFNGCPDEPEIHSKGLETGVREAYLSVELDFMAPSEITLRYHDGTWRREELLAKLDELLLNRTVVSADCSGYFGNEDAKSLLLYACVCGKIFGKDISELEALHDLARQKMLRYDTMFDELGLPRSGIKYRYIPPTIKERTTFIEEHVKFGRALDLPSCAIPKC